MLRNHNLRTIIHKQQLGFSKQGKCLSYSQPNNILALLPPVSIKAFPLASIGRVLLTTSDLVLPHLNPFLLKPLKILICLSLSFHKVLTRNGALFCFVLF